MEKKENKKFKTDYYAQAIFNIALAENSVEQSEEELKQLKDAVILNLDLKKYISDPSIKEGERINTLLEITGRKAGAAIKAFAAIMVILGLAEMSEQIYQDYVAITNRFKKQILINVISAIELEGSTLKAIKKDVDTKTGLDVRIKNIVDSNIIGGIVIKIGERVIDLSVKNKIEDMRQKLKSLELKGEYFGIEN
ncbi:MAG: ATP synthase F1 subunit delta [Actinobacteria bacterium]|nr:ATP synthase F1 subunit delta [Actinomycetota bacterium]